jgi:hypothetical protein
MHRMDLLAMEGIEDGKVGEITRMKENRTVRKDALHLPAKEI